MKKIFKPIIFCVILLAILSITSCDKQPTACIKIDQTTYSVGEKIQLNSCSKDAYMFSWFYTFNGGTVAGSEEQSSTEENPVFIPMENGECKIELRAQSKHQSKDEKTSITITVEDACYACVVGNDSIIYCTADYLYDDFKAWILYWETQGGAICTKQ